MNNGNGVLYGLGAIVLAALGFFVLRGGGGGLLGQLGRAALWGVGIAAVIVIAIVVLVVVLALRPSGRKGGSTLQSSTSARTGSAASLSQEEKTVIAGGSRELSHLRVMTMRAKDARIRELGERVCRQTDAILSTLRDKPEALPKARQFFAYYLPTIGKVMETFTRMEQSGVADPALTEKVLEYLEDARTATEKQYRNLFEADALDLTVEMEVMTAFCKREGLLSDQETVLQSDGESVSLRL